MQAATMTERTLKIDGMHGDACVQKVTGALKDMPGVTTRSVTVGSASISADKAGSDAAVAGIAKAGFKSHETGMTTENSAGGNHRDAHAPAAHGAAPAEKGHVSPDKAATANPSDRPSTSATPMKPSAH